MNLQARWEARAVRDHLYEQFARVGKAVSSPKRLEILDLLAQGARPVDQIARATSMGVTNTSAHLQVLRAARLVTARRRGKSVSYALADDGVARFQGALQEVAAARLAEVREAVEGYFKARDGMAPMGRAELARRLRRKEVVVIDVRPREEYEAGHIPGALSVPLAALPKGLAGLPRDREVVAYCRGPYCVLAPQALSLLRGRGLTARRLEDGFPEWRLAGMPVATGGGAA